MIFKLQFRRLNKGVNLTFKLWCKYTAYLYIILHNIIIKQYVQFQLYTLNNC